MRFNPLLFLAIFSRLSFAHPHTTYEPAEHTISGDRVELFFADPSTGVMGHGLHLPNGLVLTYGDLLSMPDFFGVVGEPITRATNDEDAQKRFRAAFATMAVDTALLEEAKQIVTIIHEERSNLIHLIESGKDPEDYYEKSGHERSLRWNCITGGACSGPVWWLSPGRYLKLAKENYDHFGKNAWHAYRIGHAIAMQEAILAGEEEDIGHLELAYAMNAFACHFLTDRFASGHMRTPREELPANTTPAITGSLLAGFMHNEDNKYGLHVSNQRGDKWVAYGDSHYFDKRNQTNISIMQEALQISANDIYSAYQTGVANDSEALLALLPKVDEIGKDAHRDIAPLFYWDEASGKVFRRKDLANVYNYEWTTHWASWTTLLELKKLHNIPARAQIID